MSKPTEGEWEYSRHMIVTPPEAVAAERVAAKDFPFTSRKIADVACGLYVPEGEAEANGLAMAASKELLAACELALDVFGREVVSRSPTDEEAERFEAIVCLTAAIAKAKGGASDE